MIDPEFAPYSFDGPDLIHGYQSFSARSYFAALADVAANGRAIDLKAADRSQPAKAHRKAASKPFDALWSEDRRS